MPRLFLLDGMALVYRAHFAFIRNPIRNSKGVNTSAAYGFVNTLLAILENENPTHLGVAFDTSAPTARHEKFPAYKAQRDEMPEELADAIPVVKELCAAFHIPVIERDGFEADDLIGTLATRAEAEGIETYMVTPDKDFAQLVSDKTFMWKPGRQGADHELIDEAAVKEQWNVGDPARVADILGLWGDASDNIPGVPGIGEKTAKKLIGQFGSLDELLARTSELKGKQKEKLEEHADKARLSRDLATIIRDAPVEATWDDLTVSPRDDDAVKKLFTDLEFRSLTKRLFGDAATPTDESADSGADTLFDSFRTLADTPHTYHLADTEEKQAELFAALEKQSRYCFDIETTSLDRFTCELLGVAFCWKKGEAWYLPVSDPLLPALRSLLAAPTEKIGHNLKFDLSVLHRLGIPVAGPFTDTMLVHALVAPDQRHNMDYVAESLLNYSPVKLAHLAANTAADSSGEADDLFSHAEKKKAVKELDMRSIPLDALAEYAAEDADVTFQLAEKLAPMLADSGHQSIHDDLEAPLLPVLVSMELEGIRIDLETLQSISADLQQKIDRHAASIREHAGREFNLNSPKQLGEILFDDLKLVDKPKKTRTGQYKTDEQTLAALAGHHPIIDEILAYREATKLKGTYVDALPGFVVESTGRVHTHFHQLVAATGRLASSDPNIQNIPIRTEAGRGIRRAFVPREGCLLLSADYSQIELRVMAALSGDESMIAAFRDDLDIHSATAARVFGTEEADVTPEQRSRAKMVNFGIIYGISAFGLSQRLGIPRGEAAEIINTYLDRYPAIRDFMDRTVSEATGRGWVETLDGRRRLLPDLNSANANIRGNAERAAINTPIQGTAADMIKRAMIAVDALLHDGPWQSRMLLQVHDELVFDLHPEEENELVPKILAAMRDALPLPNNVPVKVDAGTGNDWLAAH